ncbi:MAG: anti-sigma factor family protein [Rhodopirellula sp. JB055]|uniref:anti-sigma factor family protein n=1 Tax=Rhodopirellula sp. JB055 TaxID=3342846 RepID=UPI00370AA616
MNDPKHPLDATPKSNASVNETEHTNSDQTVSMAIPSLSGNRSVGGNDPEQPTIRELPVDRDDEQLVAYLDGELSGKERAELEDRLVNEESLRLRLQGLQRGWDMLDVLPTPVVDEHSVQTTLEMVVRDLTRASIGIEAVDGDHSVAGSNPLPRRRMKKWTRRLLVFSLLALVGSAVASWSWLSYSRQQQIADFPIAIDHQAYSSTDDLELVRDLADSPLWMALASHSATEDLEALVDEYGGTDELLEAVQELDEEQRATAYRRWDTFNNLSPQARSITRERAQRVSEAEDSQELRTTLRAYSRWKEQLSRDTLAAIENQTGELREHAIEEGVHETMNVIGRVTAKGLSDETIERIAFTMRQIVQQRLKDREPAAVRMMEGFRHWRFGESGERGLDQSIRYHFIARSIVGSSDRRPRSKDGKRGPESPPLTLSELHQIENMLPQADLELLRTVSTNAWFRSMVIRDWAEEALRRRGRPDSELKTLQQAYNEASPDERDVLDLLPPDEVRDQLLRP